VAQNAVNRGITSQSTSPCALENILHYTPRIKTWTDFGLGWYKAPLWGWGWAGVTLLKVRAGLAGVNEKPRFSWSLAVEGVLEGVPIGAEGSS